MLEVKIVIPSLQLLIVFQVFVSLIANLDVLFSEFLLIFDQLFAFSVLDLDLQSQELVILLEVLCHSFIALSDIFSDAVEVPLTNLLRSDQLSMHASHHGVFLLDELFHLDEVHFVLLQCLIIFGCKARKLFRLLVPIEETIKDRQLEFIEGINMLAQEGVQTCSAFFFESCPDFDELLRDFLEFLIQLTQIGSIHLRNLFNIVIDGALCSVLVWKVSILSFRVQLLLEIIDLIFEIEELLSMEVIFHMDILLQLLFEAFHLYLQR